MGRSSQPLAFEVLHAYLAGEVDPAERREIEAALERSEESRARLEEVRAMQGLFQDMAPVAPDDLTWQRMQRRVEAALSEEPGERILSGTLSPSRTPGRFAVPAAVAAAAVVATLVLLDRRPEPMEPAAHPQVSQQVLASGEAPLEVKLASGTALHLAPRSEVIVRSPALPADLVLESGELDIRAPVATHEGRPAVVVETPAYVAAARSRDFSVGFTADRYFVEAREGSVTVEGEGFGEATVVKAGQRRTVKAEAKRPASRSSRSRVQKLLESSLEKARASRRAKSAPAPAPSREALRESSEGETRVQVLEPEADPVRVLWREAAKAYYEGRDLDRAITKAREVIRAAPERPEARMAEVLLCEALIATQRGEEAIAACEARLVRPSSDEEKRQVHYLLATIHHRQLGDCSRAIPHYGQAMVFGGTSLMDDRVRLFRASCALEVGRIDLAEVDVAEVKKRRDRLPNPQDLDTLERRLQEANGEGR